jgi:hypothetical protein
VEIAHQYVIEMKLKILISILLLLISFSSAQALSLGSLQKENFSVLEKGKTKEFTLLLWNLENSSCFVKLEATYPEDLVVVIQPNEFLLNSSKIGPPYEEGEYVKISIGDVKAFPVKVLVKALDSAKGEEEVKVKLRAESPDSGIKLAQEKTFIFKVKVVEYFAPEEKSEESKKESERISSRISLPKFDLRTLLIVSFIAAIIIISFLVYKFL